MASPMSKLPDDLIRELFLLLPTVEDPTCLLRVSLTNKKCHRILADPDFRSLLQKELPPTPKVLGFLTNAKQDSTLASCPRFVVNDPASGRPAARDLPGLRVLDSRHSRVLFLTPSPCLGDELSNSTQLIDLIIRHMYGAR